MLKWFFLLLLLLPLTYAFDIDDYSLDEPIPIQLPIISKDCKAEVDAYLGQPAQEILQGYCDSVGYKALILLIAVFIMWLFEPKVARILKQSVPTDHYVITSEQWMFYYKWIGLALLFFAGYILVLLS